MIQALRKLAGTLNRTDTICLFTNQLREKIGVMFGNPETTPGGRALKFYSSVRLDIRRIETLKEGVEAIGNRVRVKVVKNKVAPPFKQAEFDIIYGSGISWEGTVLDAGLERKIVQKSGSYFSFDEERLGQGRQNATAFLREHPDVCQRILAEIQLELGAEQVASARLLPVAEGGDQNGKAGRAGDDRKGRREDEVAVPTVTALRATGAVASRSSWTVRRGGPCPSTSSSRGLGAGRTLTVRPPPVATRAAAAEALRRPAGARTATSRAALASGSASGAAGGAARSRRSSGPVSSTTSGSAATSANRLPPGLRRRGDPARPACRGLPEEAAAGVAPRNRARAGSDRPPRHGPRDRPVPREPRLRRGSRRGGAGTTFGRKPERR